MKPCPPWEQVGEPKEPEHVACAEVRGGAVGEVGQVNEVLARVLCHNICVLIRTMHELGIEPIF